MAFKGTLKEFKVPDILQLISLQKKTGILTFTGEEGFITLIFQDGMIVGADSLTKKLEMRVGSVLVKQDFISDDMLQRALDIQKRTNQKIGEILVGMGLIGRDTIHTCLKIQAIEIILSLFKWKKGEYNFKIMDYLDESMRIIEPLPTDNLIMEGVQMLDEWPQIKELIPDDFMIFEPIPVSAKKIVIVAEYDEIPEVEGDKIYLIEAETNLLRYVNGQNSVRDLVELGIFTEYKVYKGLYSLVRKSIIRAKGKSTPVESKENEFSDSIQQKNLHLISRWVQLTILLVIIILAISFFKPMRPIKTDNILLKDTLYQKVFNEDTPRKPSQK